MARKQKQSPDKLDEHTLLSRLSVFFFDRVKLSATLFLALVVAGVLSFGVWLDREGFPPIQFPLGLANGTYFVDDAERVDDEITEPLSQYLLEQDGVSEVQTTAGSNFFSIFAFYESDVPNDEASGRFMDSIDASGILPEGAQIEYQQINPSSVTGGAADILISVFSRDDSVALTELESRAAYVAAELEDLASVDSTSVNSLFDTSINPVTGQSETRQTQFGRIGVKEDAGNSFYRAVSVGVVGSESVDVIELSEDVNKRVDELNGSTSLEGFGLLNSADVAPQISTQIQSLQDNVITGLIAVSIISFLLITWRASIITALFILSVILVSMFVLLLIGYSINTISLFALVLALGLFVDDATIVVEAVDAAKKNKKAPREITRGAVKKVAAASVAGTLTTVLVFLPLVFVSGILGEFIRILPVTIIIALVTSLLLSLTLIPFLSRFILFSDKKTKRSPINRAEEWLADKIAGLPLIFRKSRKKGWGLTAFMVLISLMFIMATGIFAQKVDFNIFPPSKDSDQLRLSIDYLPGTSLEQAEDIADEVNARIGETLGGDFEKLTYFNSTERSASAFIQLTAFDQRDTTAPQYIDELETFSEIYDRADIRIVQIDAGPPEEEFPFRTQVFSESPNEALAAAADIQGSLMGAEITRPNGTTAMVTSTRIGGAEAISRLDGKRYIEVQAGFDSEDTTALVVGAQEYVETEFPDGELPEGVSLGFDFGQESENQESFNSLAVVGPLAVLAMFILLSVQFRSFLQPLLIFLAIPFSFFGVFYGLYITDNPISFFSMIGFFGLIGIAVNNTILLTDYANQERRNGLPIIESISEATRKRFRPLLATSLTTVAALTPLALTDPFWVPLAVTIIFGLISSTLLVIISFPYYYLLIEGARTRVKNKFKKGRK